ncbi:MAG: hypothetical protein ACXABO_16460 [Promethearchaeota archaeon]|jgi:hypothetical protein
MVKYNHCKKCKSVYSTKPWIGEVHEYNGYCPSCGIGEAQENQLQQESEEDVLLNKNTDQSGFMEEIHETAQISPLEVEKNLLLSLEQRATEFLSSDGSVEVLIREIKVDLVNKAKERIEETYQSFDVNKIEAQKIVGHAENILNYLSDYKDYMDNVVIKIQSKPKMKVKTALDKVFKESMATMPKDIAKDILSSKKAKLKLVFEKALKWYDLHSDTKDALELTKKMVLHPFTTIQNNLSTLTFYSS